MSKKHQLGDWLPSVPIPTFLNPHQNFLVFSSISYACLHGHWSKHWNIYAKLQL